MRKVTVTASKVMKKFSLSPSRKRQLTVGLLYLLTPGAVFIILNQIMMKNIEFDEVVSSFFALGGISIYPFFYNAFLSKTEKPIKNERKIITILRYLFVETVLVSIVLMDCFLY